MKPITVSLMVRAEVQLEEGARLGAVEELAARLDATLENGYVAQAISDGMGLAVGMSLAFPLRYELDGEPLNPIAFLTHPLPDENPADDESGEIRAKFSRMLPGDELHLKAFRHPGDKRQLRTISCRLGRKPVLEIV